MKSDRVKTEESVVVPILEGKKKTRTLTPVPIPLDVEEEVTQPESDLDVLRQIIIALTDGSPYRWVPAEGGKMRCFFCQQNSDYPHAEACPYIWARKAVWK